MGNRDKRGREKKKPKTKESREKSRPATPVIARRPATPPAQPPTNTGSVESA